MLGHIVWTLWRGGVLRLVSTTCIFQALSTLVWLRANNENHRLSLEGVKLPQVFLGLDLSPHELSQLGLKARLIEITNLFTGFGGFTTCC